MYADHTSWATSNFITQLIISPASQLFGAHNFRYLLQREHPQIWAGTELSAVEKVGDFQPINRRMSERCEIRLEFLLIVNRKWHICTGPASGVPVHYLMQPIELL